MLRQEPFGLAQVHFVINVLRAPFLYCFVFTVGASNEIFLFLKVDLLFT